MADYIGITDTQVDPDAPLTSQLGYAWRDNPIAIAEGAPGAPRIQMAAFPRLATGAVDKFTQSVATSTSPVSISLPFIQFGSFTLVISNTGTSPSYTVYRVREGSSATIFSGTTSGSHSVSVRPGDLVSITASVTVDTGSLTVTARTNGVDIIPCGSPWFGNVFVNDAP